MAGYSLIFGEFTNFAVYLRLTSAGSDTQIGGAISAHNNLGTKASQTCKTDCTKHTWSKSSAICRIDIFNSLFKILISLLNWL